MVEGRQLVARTCSGWTRTSIGNYASPMFFLSIALALGATSSAVLPVVNVDQTNVDLSGAGAVDFEGEGNKVVALLPKQLAIDLHGRIKFGHDGVPLSCQSEAEVASKEAGDELCRQMMKSAHFNLMPGFDLPFF